MNGGSSEPYPAADPNDRPFGNESRTPGLPQGSGEPWAMETLEVTVQPRSLHRPDAPAIVLARSVFQRSPCFHPYSTTRLRPDSGAAGSIRCRIGMAW